MKTDAEKSKYLFNKLKREVAIDKDNLIQAELDRLQNDCWHEWDVSNYAEHSDTCKLCGEVRWVGHKDNPDFFDPGDKEWEYFGWMWERMDENILLIDFSRERKYCFHRSLISCTALAEALYEWFKGEDG